MLAIRLALGLLALAAGALGVLQWRIHRANIRVWASDLHVWPAPKPGERILIFAPHCDDETLALSGYTQKALAAGAEVRVVVMTNGDGFTYSAEREYRRLRLNAEDYIRFGEERQREALAAMGRSGLKPSNVVFLGYPDGGLGELWLHYWTPDKPYTSRFTRSAWSPYANSLTPCAAYCGQSVLTDVKRVIRDFRPTQVFCPHAYENHADHWATYAFVTEAMWELRHSGTVLPSEEGLYLVHRGDWPVPQGEHPGDDLPPPAALLNLDTEWRQVPLTSREEAVKRSAIAEYRSQLRVMSRFLMTFLRRNELVGVRRPGQFTVVPDGTLRVVDPWKTLPASVSDPVNDTVQTDLSGPGDLVAISVAEDSRRLYIRVQARKKLSPKIAYDIYWHPLPGDAQGTRGISLRLGAGLPRGVSVVAMDNAWQLAVPKPPGKAILVNARCRYRRFTMDKTGWRLLEPSRTRSAVRAGV